MVRIGKLGRWRKVPSRYCVNNQNLPHPCKDEIEKLLNEIYGCLRKLNIFDTDNVFVCYIDIQKTQQGNNCSITTQSSAIYRNPSSVDRRKGIYVVVGNSCKLRCDNRSNIIYIGGQEGGSQSLYGRISKFIQAIENGRKDYHTCGAKIHERLYELGQNQKTCLYVIGFPIANEIIEQWIKENSENKGFLRKFVKKFFNILKSELEELEILNNDIKSKLEKLKNEINNEIEKEEGGISLEKIENMLKIKIEKMLRKKNRRRN